MTSEDEEFESLVGDMYEEFKGLENKFKLIDSTEKLYGQLINVDQDFIIPEREFEVTMAFMPSDLMSLSAVAMHSIEGCEDCTQEITAFAFYIIQEAWGSIITQSIGEDDE